MKKILLFFMFLVLVSSVSATTEDDFDRANSNTLGTATNGNTWGETGSVCEIGILNSKWYGENSASLCNDDAILDITNNPNNITFSVNISDYNTARAIFFGTDDDGTLANWGIEARIYLDKFQYYDGGWQDVTFSFTNNVEYEISLRNIEYTGYTYDIYIDDVLKKSSAGFRTSENIGYFRTLKQSQEAIYIDNLLTNYDGSTPTTDNATIFAYNTYTNASLSNFSVYFNSTEYSTTTGALALPIYYNSTRFWNFSVYADNYFKEYALNINVSTPYNASLYKYTSIYANTGVGATISNYSITWNSTEYNTTTGVVYLPLYNISNTNVSVSSAGIYNDDSVLLTASDYLENYTFTLYPDPSIVDVTIYDQNTEEKILTNITLVVSGGLFEETYSTTTGDIYVGNLTSGTFTFKFSGTNYTTQTYTLSVGENTYQQLNAYLASTTNDVTFTIVDFDSNAEVQTANMIQQRIINGTWTTISNKLSDITGRIQLQYTEDVKYRFIVSKDGYTTKTFELDPVIFDSYTVRIKKEVAVIDYTNYANIIWDISPTIYHSNTTYNISFSITSPYGALESYGFYIESPGNPTYWSNGLNAYGSTLKKEVFVNATGNQDTIDITFWYDTTASGNRTYSRSYLIIWESTGGTFEDIKNNLTFLTTFEKVLISMLLIMLVSGFAFMYGGPIAGGLVSLFVLWFFYVLGFLSIWMVLPGTLVGLVLIFWRSSS